MAYQKPKEEMMEFWRAFQEAFLVLYGTRLATIAAINGHCYAAGAVSALACDSRIMVKGPYGITLNEVAIGVVIPFWIRDLLRCTVGHRQAERAMQLGTIYNAEEALRIGMVDEAVDEDKLMDSVREEMGRFLKIQGVPRAKCKQELRGKFLRNLRERREEDAHQMAENFTSDLVQNNIAAFLASRSRRE
ncbi:enoyl-CoA delta isomerase 1, mitochondrial-like [Diadema setosum]|uniref:enoyl-CoA delta isomerase 1, mitochondrial-like n=1 Tax=Diadema setosum TaxID=31175 RepID=UPI003B3A3E2E